MVDFISNSFHLILALTIQYEENFSMSFYLDVGQMSDLFSRKVTWLRRERFIHFFRILQFTSFLFDVDFKIMYEQ